MTQLYLEDMSLALRNFKKSNFNKNFKNLYSFQYFMGYMCDVI